MCSDSSPICCTIEGDYRWQIYRRLCELDISCSCTAYQPLTVQINSPIAFIQLWSVIRQATIPRQTLVDGLERCWRYRA
ncbi:hypothetical protein IQ250_05060 [Pseudanabaenaceae cyanobacterium LEGE 13415]|nr:hypothetical protein [Pseudanabaenaceae cyanobacterium LEGE 13415]